MKASACLPTRGATRYLWLHSQIHWVPIQVSQFSVCKSWYLAQILDVVLNGPLWNPFQTKQDTKTWTLDLDPL